LQIDSELVKIISDAWDKKLDFVEIIPGKGSGALKEKVIKFLNQKQVKQKYSRYDVDNKNFGRIFVHFNWNKLKK
jgi:dsDNA-specific endonuclease/ATPase MutS2